VVTKANALALEGLRLLGRHDGVVEVRILKTKKGTISGYFNNLERAAQALARWDGVATIYVTANPVDPVLLARADNRLVEFARETTRDQDIVRRAWFLIDLDAVRKPGISATNAEVAAALARRDDLVAFLRELEFPAPVMAMSGNGAHALWPVELPNDAAITTLVEEALKALGARFSDQVVQVDEAVFNLARVWKCYGTLAVKGDPTADRPHRRAMIESVPGDLVLLPREAIERLAAMAPGRTRTGRGPAPRRPTGERLDLVAAFAARGWYKEARAGGKHGIKCPWADEHSGNSGPSETCLFEPRGEGEPWGFKCLHAHCAARTIRDVLDVLGLGRASRDGHYADVGPDDDREDPPAAPAATTTQDPLAAGFIARYVAVAQARTDAPVEAHVLAAILVLSALAGSRVRLPLAYRADGVRLVLWGMNIADSTSNRKTTVNELALDVIRQVLGEAAILPWKGSPEAFVQALRARDGQVAVFSRDEYTGLLAQMKKGGYVTGLAQDFIRAYDGLPIVMARTAKMNRKTGQRVDDTDRVRDPYLVNLCAATRTSFIETATIEDVLDGHLARFVFTSGAAEERPMQPMTAEIEAAWREMVALARDFHERAQEVLRIELPPAVLAREWQLEQRLKALALKQPRPDAARPAMKRLAETVLKVAALLALDRVRDGCVTVTEADFDAAARLAEPWQRTTLALLADLGRTRFQARSDAVLATIRAHREGITHRKAFRAHRGLTSREFGEVIMALEEQALIHRWKAKGTGPGRPTVIYRAGAPRSQPS
jgi:hypothetical protein